MNEKLLWGALGGLVATIFNVLYNYIREAINRRWQVATEVAGTLDYYYAVNQGGRLTATQVSRLSWLAPLARCRHREPGVGGGRPRECQAPARAA